MCLFLFCVDRSFDMVYKFLLKQTDRPFLKRYLKRDEILRQIAACDSSLSDSLNAFSVRPIPLLSLSLHLYRADADHFK